MSKKISPELVEGCHVEAVGKLSHVSMCLLCVVDYFFFVASSKMSIFIRSEVRAALFTPHIWIMKAHTELYIEAVT